MNLLSEMITVTNWHLEQTSSDDVVAPVPRADDRAMDVVLAKRPSPEFARFLYTAVGNLWSWTDRILWTYQEWQEWLTKDGVETWVAWVDGSPAGYIQLEGRPEGEVEVMYFGLLPDFMGQGLGSRLLAEGLARAWDLADRHPLHLPTRRVTVLTCSLDGPNALRTYQARGFRLVRTDSFERAAVPPPGPWPGSGRLTPETVSPFSGATPG
ncbi:GNAT family N-acetyltransferase [Kitasatospora sp. NPDC049285]|uniref:GNAT family N-acetyltransferase n=1 Tax=Kitasatospora sp. NPDC049285 TaxID=3157096 RepID=UPI003432133B